jgi:hypothetical protein
MLTRRLTTQVTQIRRALLQAGDEILSTTGLLGDRRTALSDWLDSLRNGDVHAKKRKPAGSDEPFERDYFNLHKMIVVTTLHGKVPPIFNARYIMAIHQQLVRRFIKEAETHDRQPAQYSYHVPSFFAYLSL